MFNGAAVLSLLLCVATVALWVRSYSTWDLLYDQRFTHATEGQTMDSLYFGSDWGSITVSRAGIFYPAAGMAVNPYLLYRGAVARGLQSVPSPGRYHYEQVGAGSPELFRVAGFQLTTGAWPAAKDPYRRHRLTLVVPLWFVTVVTAAAPLGLVLRRFRQREPSHPRCLACGYNLTGNVSGVCPECGRAITHRFEI
jgi:hypothetical protein